MLGAEWSEDDILICATGFDTTYKPNFPIVGSLGQSLHDAWENDVNEYLGLAVPHYPNYFMTLGPNSPVGNGPVLIAIEQQVSYIIQMLSKFKKENVRSFEVSQETESFNHWKDAFMQHTVWTQACRSWYKAGFKSGRVVAVWPGSTLHYLDTIKAPRYEDWRWSDQRGVIRGPSWGMDRVRRRSELEGTWRGICALTTTRTWIRV